MKSLFAFWVGGAASTPTPPPSTQPGYRSLLAFWLGGARCTTGTPVTTHVFQYGSKPHKHRKGNKFSKLDEYPITIDDVVEINNYELELLLLLS